MNIWNFMNNHEGIALLMFLGFAFLVGSVTENVKVVLLAWIANRSEPEPVEEKSDEEDENVE